jgi:PAT family beta-lactamase induction signal transducer AmpG
MSRSDRVAPAFLGLFAALYALQGIVVAYFFNFNKVYMETAGVSDERAGWAQSLATLPLALKFFGGILSDRVKIPGWGHRLPYITLGVVLESVGLVGLIFLHPHARFGGFVTMAVIAVVGLALYDTCCDGLILDITPEGDRPRVQGIIFFARFLATMLFSYGFGHWLQRTGEGPGKGDGVIWVCAALGVIPLVWTLSLREPLRPLSSESFQWSAFAVLIRPWSLVLLALGLIYSLVAFGVEIELSSYYRSRGFTSSDRGDLAAIRYFGRAAGALSLPFVWARLSRAGILAAGMVGLAATTLAQVLVTGKVTAVIFGFAFGYANGWDDALFCILAMEACDPRLAASTYALIMAVTNLGSLGGGLFTTTLKLVGGRYSVAFLIFALGALSTLVCVPTLARPARRTEAAHEPLG